MQRLRLQTPGLLREQVDNRITSNGNLPERIYPGGSGAIHSLTASSGEEAPRGLSFLLKPNRLNVAISRDQYLSIVVGSPSLASGIANTMEEAEQINQLDQLTHVSS